MERASRIMYSIANIFTWVLAILSILGIVLSVLAITKTVQDVDLSAFGTASLVYFIIVLVVAILTITLVRIAKNKNSSKGWDVLFLILGILGDNIFYFLGGLFGIIANRR